jgi:hypothetical protein
MYVYVYKYCFIPSGCINIFLMSYLFIYIYSFTHAGNCRYEEVLRVILYPGHGQQHQCQDNQPAVNIQVYEGSESIKR